MSNKLKVLRGVSYYEGEPTIAISKSTGNLSLYDDHLEFEIHLGSALGGVFGLGGMLIAWSKAIKNGRVSTYRYADIAGASEKRYAGMMPMVTLVMKDGRKHSFVPLFGAADAVKLIRSRLQAA